MTLLVVGNSLERTLPVAAVAAVASGERVTFTCEEYRDALAVTVEGTGLSGPAVIVPVPLDASIAADSFIFTAPPEEYETMLRPRAEQCAGKPVLLAPGGFGGVLANIMRFREWGLAVPHFAEVPGWLASGRLAGDRIDIVARKRNLAVAGASDGETAVALRHFGRYVPDLTGSDLVTTSLSNVNAIIHPPLAILNATRIENAEEWFYWDEGLTPGVHRLMEAVDRERMAVIQAVGGKPVSLSGLSMGPSGTADAYYTMMKSSPLFRRRRGPDTLASRFLTDDVPNGVAAFEQMAAALGLEHPALTAVRTLSEIILGRPLKADAAVVDAMVAYVKARKTAAARPAGGTAS